MPHLFGRTWTRADLLARVGRMEQVAGVRSVRLQGGRAQGVAALEVAAGDGLRFTVLPDRCMDVAGLEYRGVPLAWHSRTGITAPAYFDPAGDGWLRSFGGGLLATCGLRQVGWPCVDAGESLGLHGRIGNTPAEQVHVEEAWEGDEYLLRVGGTMREARVFGEDLRLTRSITVQAGAKTFTLSDRVENLCSAPSPLMLLYHINLGFPLLAPESRLLVASQRITPKDTHSREGLSDVLRFGPPQPGWREQNYWHDVRPDAAGYCTAALVQPELALPFARGLGLAVRWQRRQLWNLVHWKQLGIGDYVTAIEPANCHTLGRAQERALGTLESLAPGEVRTFDLEFTVLVGEDEIAAFTADLPSGATEHGAPTLSDAAAQ